MRTPGKGKKKTVKVQILGASLVAGAAVLLASMGVVEAQRRGGRDNAAMGVPVSTTAVVEDPDAYYGKLVTMSAGVELRTRIHQQRHSLIGAPPGRAVERRLTRFVHVVHGSAQIQEQLHRLGRLLRRARTLAL